MHHTPRQLPQLLTMLDNIPASEKEIAKHLGLSLTTLKKYRRNEQAPRPVMLALFWLTSWGMGAIDAELVNRERIASQGLKFAKLEARALRKQVDLLERERGKYGVAANAPSFGTRAQVLKNDDFERLGPAALLYMARGDAAQ